MFKFITPVILITISIAVFFTFTGPLYQDVSSIRRESESYNEALGNSKTLENERDKLTQKYNSLGGENLDRLKKMVPSTVDNIRLVLEIEKLAMAYGMGLKDVRYDTVEKSPAEDGIVVEDMALFEESLKDYGVWNLEFSIEGTYDNFMNFLKDLENNLRLVDVVSIDFSSGSSVGGASSNLYKYSFNIKTYWLKN
ncbi:hypothetical protein A3D42_01470 [Candidatus Nomurabacteria bacterium RIFCSPHIGHO2_02_FULL_41_18]|uniref:Type 4a pilus biogenesis protein PilO n=1 Tax=Candidatus Nomurabacteria bacterium RIFCSPHIGHO2_02_FULL_41_18 TaxID=1801754 RepID=A0A1F6W7J4_9BACT|nr:MAG: hypothetical protein A2737_00325 [Candidatus Nomurabacteria bacterium RIFCSPHIGHO2_01_FULL_41_71]OGI77861.1 MAG: hypothetical protein A3D42_01470 [Candidatus Nomurabacteria bacterium RIFCSPHIGHO2_02_FULL_41_18]OGI90034.1 MAG: hypothetical protein A3B01_02155 [Candidatus Nomurabacteria bacterium RIFCSPLOWO2_01_FULL_41_52b]OGJ00111.1 MAG: hypothetical protein A3I90_01185 [Candidatus Nomurabacteria bacterium RIFCSPLOWO2_02_FULL_41_9]